MQISKKRGSINIRETIIVMMCDTLSIVSIVFEKYMSQNLFRERDLKSGRDGTASWKVNLIESKAR